MKNGIMSRKEFKVSLIDQVFRVKEQCGYKSVNDLVNEAIEELEENGDTIDAVKKGSLNMRISQENIEKIGRIAEASKTKVGNKILGGNDTAVIALALENFIKKREAPI